MEVALRVVYLVATAQSIQAIPLSRVHFLRQHQRIQNGTKILNGRIATFQPGQLAVQEPYVERGVVNDQFRAIDEFQKLIGNIGEQWLVRKEIGTQPMHFLRSGIHFSLRVQIPLETVSGQTPIDHFDTADLNDAVALFGLQTRRLCIKDYLSQEILLTQIRYRRICCRYPGWPGHRLSRYQDRRCGP